MRVPAADPRIDHAIPPRESEDVDAALAPLETWQLVILILTLILVPLSVICLVATVALRAACACLRAKVTFMRAWWAQFKVLGCSLVLRVAAFIAFVLGVPVLVCDVAFGLIQWATAAAIYQESLDVSIGEGFLLWFLSTFFSLLFWGPAVFLAIILLRG